jgi:2-haloalkanoic acid dehalogenase type II
MNPSPRFDSPHFDGVLFDLLTALLDSWTLWNSVAGSEAAGRAWRTEYLRRTYATGAYRPYEALVAEAAEALGLPLHLADDLDARYAELRPWPGVTDTLKFIADQGIPLAVVTNCSERLGHIAASAVHVPFRIVVTAERAGFYKPNPAPYRLGVAELGLDIKRCLFVAGSPFDLVGTGPLGLATYWHDRSGMALPPGATPPLVKEPSLDRLPEVLFGTD